MAVVINGNGTLTGVTAQDELNVDSNTLVVDSTNDRVGVGTTSPVTPLHIAKAGNGIFTIERSNKSSGTGYFGINVENNSQTTVAYDTNSKFVIGRSTDPSDQSGFNNDFVIDSSGNVGIGGSWDITKTYIQFNPASTHGMLFAVESGTFTNNYVYFQNSGGNKIGSISSNNSTVAYNTSSDYRLKENVVDMDGAIDRVKALQPRRFNWIADEDDTTVDGFIAHEVSDVVPEAISGEKDATETYTDDDGVEQTRDVYQGIDQSKLVPLLTGALQEAIAKIEALETRIEALENA